VYHILKEVDEYIDEKRDGDDMEARTRENIHYIIIYCLYTFGHLKRRFSKPYNF
jgi:hypothetical protein